MVVTAKFSNFYFTMYAEQIGGDRLYMLTGPGPLKTYNKFNLMLPDDNTMSIENGSKLSKNCRKHKKTIVVKQNSLKLA